MYIKIPKVYCVMMFHHHFTHGSADPYHNFFSLKQYFELEFPKQEPFCLECVLWI